MRSIYEDGTYLARNPRWHEDDAPWKAEQVATMLAKHRIAPARVCEVGCGSGEVLRCLADASGGGTVFFGYDVSPQALEISSRKETADLHFILGRPEADGAAFDVALALDVIEHVEDYLGFLRDLRGTATYKVFAIPLDLSVQSVWRARPIVNGRSSVGHIHYFTKETALAALEDTGYEVLDWVYTRASVDRPTRGWRAAAMKVPRSLCFALNRDLTARILGGFSLLVLAR